MISPAKTTACPPLEEINEMPADILSSCSNIFKALDLTVKQLVAVIATLS